MNISSTITFAATRSVSSSGNTEWYQFQIASSYRLNEEAVKKICQIHECFGQSFSFEELKVENGYAYKGAATCYC
jgi:hypothetical protein